MTSEGIYLSLILETSKTVLGLGQAVVAFKAAQQVFNTLKAVVVDLTAAWFEQEQATAKIGAVLKSTNGAVGITARGLADLASEIQNTTTYADELVMNAEAVMLTFTKVGRETFPDAMKAAADLSAVMGQDLQSSVLQIGKALQDPIAGVTALRRAGVMLNDQQETQIKTLMEQNDQFGAQTIILRELKKEFGGAAEAMGKTNAGAMERLKNAIGDLKEIGGRKFAEFAAPTVDWLLSITTAANRTISSTQDLKNAWETAGTANATKDAEELAAQLDAVAQRQDVIAKAFREGFRVWDDSEEQYKHELQYLGQIETALWQQKAALDAIAATHRIIAAWQKLGVEIDALIAEQKAKEADEVRTLEADYARLDEGQIDALKEKIQYYEDINDWSADHQRMEDLVLVSLREQLKVLESAAGIAEARKKYSGYSPTENVPNMFPDYSRAVSQTEDISETVANTTDYLAHYTTAIADIVDYYGELVPQAALVTLGAKEAVDYLKGWTTAIADIVDYNGELVQQSPLVTNDVLSMYKAYESIDKSIADIVDYNGELVQQGPLIVQGTADAAAEYERMLTAVSMIPDALGVVSTLMDGDVMDAAIDLIGLMGPQGQLVAGILKAAKSILSDLIPAFDRTLETLSTVLHDIWANITGGMTAHEQELFQAAEDAAEKLKDELEDAAEAAADAAQAMADSFVDVFASAIAEGDWAGVEEALTKKIGQAVLNGLIAGSAMASASQVLVDAIQDYLAGTGAWGDVLRAKDILLDIGHRIAEVFGELFPSAPDDLTEEKTKVRAFARGGVALGPTLALIGEAGPEVVSPLGSALGSRSVTVNFNGPTFASEGQLRSYVVSAVREADRGY